MSQDKLPAELRFRKGDIVKMVQLKSKKKWNGKYATIIGTFNRQKNRWPVEISFDDKANALLQVKNLRIHKTGPGWIINTNSPIQRLNLLLKAYTRDLEAFSKLTRRQKDIFDAKFVYQMHDDIVCKGLGEFDQQLNLLKLTIIKLAEANKGEQAEKFLIDDTQVMAMNDELTLFCVIVSIKIGNQKVWKRVSEVQLDKKSKLVSSAKIVSMEVTDDPKAKESANKDKESKDDGKEQKNDLQSIANAIYKNKKIDQNKTS